jgi:anthranilate synthase/aminodeoxychorismate synthase-like glutamine amidotransferase
VILLIDNYDSFTWNLVQRFGELDPSLDPDKELVVVRNDKISPDEAEMIDAGRGPSHIVISPGPCTPREAGVSSAVMQRFAGRVPILGVCLGHQCMADSSGMTVARHRIQMHGKTSPIHHDNQGLFAGLPNPFEATRYHSLAIVPTTMPPAPGPGADGWVASAWAWDPDIDESDRTMENRVIMGLRRVWADAARQPWEGVQFHPESFLTLEGPRLLANFLAMGPRPRSAPGLARLMAQVRAAIA